MSYKCGYFNTKIFEIFLPQSFSSGGGAITSDDVDVSNCLSPILTVGFGADAGGNTLNGTNYITLQVQGAEDDGTGSPGSYVNLEDADVERVFPDGTIAANGIWKTVNANAQLSQSYSVGVVNPIYKFLRVVVTPNGTINNGIPIFGTATTNVLKQDNEQGTPY